MEDPLWLTDAEFRAWIGYRRMRARLDLQLARDLARESGLSEADYDVLSTLSETEGYRLRLGVLAARMLWSKSRLSHHITRMQQRGLVARDECAEDGRSSFVVLTASGLRAIEAAAPLHLASVRRHFIGLLASEQITTLADIAQAVLDHLAGVNPDLSGLPRLSACTHGRPLARAAPGRSSRGHMGLGRCAGTAKAHAAGNRLTR